MWYTIFQLSENIFTMTVVSKGILMHSCMSSFLPPSYLYKKYVIERRPLFTHSHIQDDGAMKTFG